MSKDPSKALKTIGSDIEKVAKDPEAFAKEMAQKIEDKALEMVQVELNKLLRNKDNGDYVDESVKDLTNCVLCVFKDDKKNLQVNIKNFIKNKYAEIGYSDYEDQGVKLIKAHLIYL